MEHKIMVKCRVCLDDFDEEKMFDLFKEDCTGEGSKAELKLSQKVEYCCGVRIRESSEMPSKICVKCFDMTRMWFTFRQMCINSQIYLESLCQDTANPNDSITDKADYLETLLEDLQTFRAEARNSNAAFQTNLTNGSEILQYKEGDESDDDDIEQIDFSDSSDMESEVDSDYIPKRILNEKVCDDEEHNTCQQIGQKPNQTQRKLKSTQQKTHDNQSSKKERPPSPKSFMCSICGNVYMKKAAFTYHMTLHSDVKPHECELCGKKFRQVCELKNHMRRHTGEKPYKCSYCDRHFIDRSEKHRHERVHTNTRPYVCTICGKSFMYSAILKNHSKLHSGEKDFNCLVCQKAFTLSHQLKAHLQTLTHKLKESEYVSAGYEILYE